MKCYEENRFILDREEDFHNLLCDDYNYIQACHYAIQSKIITLKDFVKMVCDINEETKLPLLNASKVKTVKSRHSTEILDKILLEFHKNVHDARLRRHFLGGLIGLDREESRMKRLRTDYAKW